MPIALQLLILTLISDGLKIVLLAQDNRPQRYFIVANETDHCLKEGDMLVARCTVEDEAGTGATVWSGSNSVFNCPSVNSILDEQIYLLHGWFNHTTIQNPRVFCTQNIAGEIIEYYSSHYTSILNVSAVTYEMNNGYIFCRSFYEIEAVGEVQLAVGGKESYKCFSDYHNFLVVVPESPKQINVVFVKNLRNEFRISWDMPDTVGGVSGYHVKVLGDECGNCSNFSDSNFQGTALLCSDWVPDGQVCRVMVKTITSDCRFVSEIAAVKSIYLQCNLL